MNKLFDFKHFKGDTSKGLTIIPCELINHNSETLKDIILKYISDAENGNRKTVKDPTKNITPGSIRNFNSFRTKFAEFESQAEGSKR